MGWSYLSIRNLSGCTVEVCEWISNFIPQFIMGVITYPKLELKLIHLIYIYIVKCTLETYS